MINFFVLYKAIDLLTNSNDSILAKSYNSIDCVYDTKGDHARALECYKKKHWIFEKKSIDVLVDMNRH